MKRIYKYGVLAACLVLGGCATLSKEECQQADWYALGMEDGAQGHPLARLGEHREACSEHGIRPDSLSYERGRERGLLEYCTYQRGLGEGRAGYSYHGVCPADTEPLFLEGYHLGRELRSERARLDAARRSMSEIRERLGKGVEDDRTRRELLDQLERLQDEAQRRAGRLERLEQQSLRY